MSAFRPQRSGEPESSKVSKRVLDSRLRGNDVSEPEKAA